MLSNAKQNSVLYYVMLLLWLILAILLMVVNDKLPGEEAVRILAMLMFVGWLIYVKPTNIEVAKEGGKKALIVLVPFWIASLCLILFLSFIAILMIYLIVISGISVVTMFATLILDAGIVVLITVLTSVIYKSYRAMLPHLK